MEGYGVGHLASWELRGELVWGQHLLGPHIWATPSAPGAYCPQGLFCPIRRVWGTFPRQAVATVLLLAFWQPFS